LDESRVTVDVKKWIEIWKKIQYLLAEDGAFIAPQVGPTRFEVIQDDVKGYHSLPSTSRI
jgi:ABC-type transport system substrate-binding protein